MTFTLEHVNGLITINEEENGKRHIFIKSKNNCFIPRKECLTDYPLDLIQKIFQYKGVWLCNEILRDEDPSYIQRDLYFSLMSYLDRPTFAGKRILDFGCGSGASTLVLSRMFPESFIIGVDFQKNSLEIAKSRLNYYKSKNIEFICSPSSKDLPKNIGEFDYIVMSGVYEHLLPDERSLGSWI